MTRAEALKELRELLDDSAGEPYKWSSTRLTSLMEEGQDKFCEGTGFFRDATNYILTTESGVKTYPLPDRAIKVLAIWNGTTQLSRKRQHPEGVIAPIPETSGPPSRFQTDLEPGFIRLTPTPDGIYTYTMFIQRYSRTPLSKGEFEIHPRCHRACVVYAASKILSIQDRETYDPKKAASFRVEYDEYVTEGKRIFFAMSGTTNDVEPVPYYTV